LPLVVVGRPDAARLEDAGTELTLDLDMTLENGDGRTAHLLPNSTLMPGDIPASPTIASPFTRSH